MSKIFASLVAVALLGAVVGFSGMGTPIIDGLAKATFGVCFILAFNCRLVEILSKQ